jgi:hypothetical protein
MQNAVQQIVRKIKRGRFFDSHFVISQIIKKKNYHQLYVHFARSPTMTTGQMNGQIAKIIQGLHLLVRDCKKKSWSDNIYGRPCSCALWQRI